MHSVSSSARVALAAADWHADIVNNSVESFRSRLTVLGVAEIDVHRVPGAFELPLLVRRLALTGQYDAVAATALVVDGGIYRHEYVASTVVDALMHVQLQTDVPILSGVLTPHHFHEHDEHRDRFSRHFAIKGEELADAVVATLGALAVIPQTTRAG